MNFKVGDYVRFKSVAENKEWCSLYGTLVGVVVDHQNDKFVRVEWPAGTPNDYLDLLARRFEEV